LKTGDRTVISGIGHTLITVTVWVHAAVTVVHAAAHVGAGVQTSLPALLYIWLIIIIGPIAGWWLVRSGRVCVGCGVIGACMTGALIFGALNHFVWPGVDRVDMIAVGVWRAPFQVTAVLLALTEALGAIAALHGLWVCRRGRTPR
jgi:hypothetical protein